MLIIIEKILEIAYEQIKKYFNNDKVEMPEESGFRYSYGCETAISTAHQSVDKNRQRR